MNRDLTVAIMAGGKSSRMGTNKSFVSIAGKPMIEHVLAVANRLSQEIILITNEAAPYAYLGLPMYADLYPDHGPLAGIYTAVTQAKNTYSLVVATDMPWLNLELLHYMIGLKESADVIVPRWQKFPEPLHAIYSKAALPAIRHQLDQGELKITRFFGQVRVRFIEKEEIERFDKDGRSFSNINTPGELKKASGKKGSA